MKHKGKPAVHSFKAHHIIKHLSLASDGKSGASFAVRMMLQGSTDTLLRVVRSVSGCRATRLRILDVEAAGLQASQFFGIGPVASLNSCARSPRSTRLGPDVAGRTFAREGSSQLEKFLLLAVYYLR